MPCAQVDANDDRDEGDCVIEARTVVCGFGVNADEDQDDQNDEQRRQRVFGEEPIIEAMLTYQLCDGNSSTEDAPNDDVEEAVHAAVEPPENDGDGEPVA